MNYGMHVVLVTCFVRVCESPGQGGLHSYPGQYKGSSVLHRERINQVILYALLRTIFINFVECVFFGKFDRFGLCVTYKVSASWVICECMFLGRVCDAIYGASVCVREREAGGMEREPLAPVFDLRCCS